MKNVKLLSLALSMLICFVASAQEKIITGNVTDEASIPLPGVTIVIKNTKNTTQTDFDGKYSIKAQKGDVLMFSYIGFNSQTKTVGDQNVINVQLITQNQSMNEVVVVAYGTSDTEYESRGYSRRDKKMAAKTITSTLQGRVAGLPITGNYVQPAPNQNIIIRGTASLSPKDEPLYIIDGVPVKSDQFSKINPNDVEEVKVIKEAEATSLYGNRASNGVVLVATKNGIYKNLTEKELNAKLKKITVPQPVEPNEEDYNTFVENAFESPKTAPLSTFSIDVDNASYTNVRRFINNGQAVPKDAVRVEEMVNFFKYNYPQPKDQHPFSINTEVSDSPWNPNNKILKIGLQGKNIPTNDLPASNLVFLIDVSGSMSDLNKLPLLKMLLHKFAYSLEGLQTGNDRSGK